MLKQIKFQTIYNTSESDIIKDFFEKALSHSIEYKRGVGYFTSGWLSQNAKGLAKFIDNGGKAQYITSPIIDQNDLDALKGNFDKSIIDKNILKNIEILEKELEENTKNLLGWLVYDEIIEFKFAIPRHDLAGGDFHDKFGVFIDKDHNIVSFTGSINETLKGFLNYESITVFCSWIDETSHKVCQENLDRFNTLWNNEDPNIYVYKIDEITRDRLIKFRTTSKRPYNISRFNLLPHTPNSFLLRDYQKKAIKSWLSNNGRGILSMATGSGKTKTALYTIVQIINKYPQIAVLVVVPYNHLLEQWINEANDFNIDFIPCNSDYSNWEKNLSSKISSNLILKKPIFIITTNSTYKSEKFQSQIKKLNNVFLVVDEVHNFGSRELIKKYLDNAVFRLGLSATPQRHFDEEGSQKILDYFGGVVFEFTLKEGIERGYLTKYFYYPIFVHLTDDEEKEYIQLSQKISQYFQVENNVLFDENNLPQTAKLLLIKRSRILESAKNKQIKLIEILKKENLVHSFFNLFYVSSNIEISNHDKIREIDIYKNLLLNLGMNVESFTSFETKWQRKILINKLKNKIIQGLVAIKCLDEGVDIPSVQRAFILASSSNPKEFIQRRGRILRKSPAKEYAYIYDFIVVPKATDFENYEYEKKYLEKELKRFQEFASLAENSYEAESKIFELKKRYNLLYI